MTQHVGTHTDSDRSSPPHSSAELHRQLTDLLTDCCVVTLDVQGRVLTWNRGAERITGYLASEMLGRSMAVCYPPDDVVAGKPQRDLADADREGRVECDQWRVDRNGSWLRVHVAIAALHDAAGVTIGFAEVARTRPEALADVERAIQTREEMLAIVGHDLRNPMHAIMAAASMLAIQAQDDQQRRRIAIIQRSAKEMERLLNDLLDVARIDSGHLVVRRERIDVRALLEETVETFHAPAATAGVTLVCEAPDGIPDVAGERDRLLQVLSNLIANALRFTSPGGRVMLRAVPADAAVHVSVKDSGDGIPPEDLPKVFERFWRADQGSMRGAGLGLAICKSIVEAHGGRIWVASRVGRGTTFHFTLPYVSA